MKATHTHTVTIQKFGFKLRNFLTRGPHLSYTHLPSSCAAHRSNGADASRSLPSLCRCRRGGRSRFSGRRATPSRPRSSPELATCLAPSCASLSSPSPSSVSPWTTHEAPRARQPESRVSLHESQIHLNRSSSTFLASSSTSPSRAPSTRAPGILGFAAVGHQ